MHGFNFVHIRRSDPMLIFLSGNRPLVAEGETIARGEYELVIIYLKGTNCFSINFQVNICFSRQFCLFALYTVVYCVRNTCPDHSVYMNFAKDKGSFCEIQTRYKLNKNLKVLSE